jgi:tetratricopeptide (TPR) repeat protein
VLRACILRRLGRTGDALQAVDAVLADDPLDAWARHELGLLRGTDTSGDLLPGGVQVHLDVAHDYAVAGLCDEAMTVLHRAEVAGAMHPLIPYTMAWLETRRGNEAAARAHAARGREAAPDLCFPARLEEIGVLETAERLDPTDPRAPYYLGNLLYDRRRYDAAMRAWRRSVQNDASFAIVHRNLGIAESNVRRRPAVAYAAYLRARRAAPRDARLLYEFDQLRKRLGDDPVERLALLESETELVASRDDLTVERLALLNQLGRHEEAIDGLRRRRFHPWEGGEGLVSGQWIDAHLGLARCALADRRPADAIVLLEAALTYPPNLGEGKHLLTEEHEIQFLLGLAHRANGTFQASREWFERAAAPQGDRAGPIGVNAYWRALALRELGDEAGADPLLRKFRAEARRRARTQVRIDYFATSLPSLLLFDDDLQARNRIECLLLGGLAQLAVGDLAAARRASDSVGPLGQGSRSARVLTAELHRARESGLSKSQSGR